MYLQGKKKKELQIKTVYKKRHITKETMYY